MNKIVASVGLVALGTSSLHAAEPSSSQGPRPWSVSATLDGFYDDNINSYPNNFSPGLQSGSGIKVANFSRGSVGFEFTPAVFLNWPWQEQTTVTAHYAYSFKYFEEKPLGNTANYDQIHDFGIGVDHNFSENYQLSLKDSLVIGQEPDLLRAANIMSTFARVSGNNLRNSGTATLDGQLTPLLGFELGYAAVLYAYSDHQPFILQNVSVTPSIAGLLNRIDQTVHLDSRWQVLPETVFVAGYQYVDSMYTADQQIDISGDQSSVRNSHSHYGYVGFDERFQPGLSGSLRIGAHYTDYYNDDSKSTDPYVQLSLRYAYGPESSLEGGFTLDRAATDLIGAGSPITSAQGITLDSESYVVYARLKHRIVPKLFGSVIAQFQDSIYNGGEFNDKSEQFYSVGLNLDYKFSNYLSGHVGYNYDYLNSEAPMNRTFDRNRIYFGLTASY